MPATATARATVLVMLLGGAAAARAAEPIPDTPPPLPANASPVAEVIAASAARPLPRAETERLRGGFTLTSSVGLEITIDFAASVNGLMLEMAEFPNGYSGVMLGVVDGTPSIVGSNDFTGVISHIQNSLDYQNIQTLTRVDLNVTSGLGAFQAGTLRSEMSFLQSSGM